MRIGLLGFGVVGRGVYDLVSRRSDMTVASVVCLEEVTLPDARVTKDFSEVLSDSTIDTVVECMGGLHPAYEFVRAAMEAGKNIVTSNKALVATYYDELLPLAQRMGIRFRCTAAVGGGIGWLSELERARRSQQLLQVGGIMNGTCNYILDSMTRLGLGYTDALSKAQALGYAEANPATDVDGIDTWHKIILSANVAFGMSLDKNDVPVAGIRHINAEDVENFRANGYVCKLIATAKCSDEGEISAFVQPTLVPQSAPEAAVPANYNLITLVGEHSGRMSFFGQGAGRYPTAYNVVQDCTDVLAGRGFYSPYGRMVNVRNQEKMRYYIRAEKDSWLEENCQDVWGSATVTGPVSVSDLHQWLRGHADAFVAAIPVYEL